MAFSDAQLLQLRTPLTAAGWTPEDVRRFGQAGRDQLVGVRDLFRRGGDIVVAIIEGRTELWFAPGQKTDLVWGRTILAHLTKTGILASCADLDELKVLQAKGIEFFRKYFAGKVVFGPRGVEDDFMPCLFESRGKVMQGWLLLDNVFWANHLMLRRK